MLAALFMFACHCGGTAAVEDTDDHHTIIIDPLDSGLTDTGG
jgi:hypothetical protein